MKRLSRITLGMFFVLFCSLFVVNVYSESKYREYDIKAMGLWYEGSIYKANKEYHKAKEYYVESLALAQNPKLRREIEEAIYYINKHLGMMQKEF